MGMKSNLFFIFFAFCYLELGSQSATSDRIIYDITKNDLKLLTENIIYFQMSQNWSLTEQDINSIIEHKKKELMPDDMVLQNAFGFAVDGIFIYAKVKENKKNYHITLGSQSWFTTTDNNNKVTKIYSCIDKNISKLFIGDYVTEGLVDDHPELEKRYRANIKQNADYLESKKVSSKWENKRFVFEIKRNTNSLVDVYCIDVSQKVNLSVNNTTLIQCFFYEKNDTLFLYNNSVKNASLLEYTITSKYGASNKSYYFTIQPGGYFLKIFKKKDLYFAESPYFAKSPYLRKEKRFVLPIKLENQKAR